MREAQTTVFDVPFADQVFRPGKGGWKMNPEGMEKLRHAGRLMATVRSLNYVRYLDDFAAFPLTNFWEDTQSGSGMDKVYVVQTNTEVIERRLLMTTDPGDLVLDPSTVTRGAVNLAAHPVAACGNSVATRSEGGHGPWPSQRSSGYRLLVYHSHARHSAGCRREEVRCFGC